jgi:CBS-domain-containing membrane protein
MEELPILGLPTLDAEHEPELTDEDIFDAMRQIPGYIDISTEDFRVIYHLAWRHAMDRQRRQPANGS